MATALLGLGSNLGDREGTLRAAMEEIDGLPNVRVVKHSAWHRFAPLGGAPGQAEFLNGAAVVETTIPPLAFLDNLQRIESRHARERSERWAARTLDIDLLLYGDAVIEMPALVVPHLRMSFRRFVLEPAKEVAPKMIHPVIGWPVERLLLHLNAARSEAVLLSPSEALRNEVADSVAERFGAAVIERPTFKTADALWPAAYASWLSLGDVSEPNKAPASKPGGLAYAAAAFPKLTILLDAGNEPGRTRKTEWSATVRQPGRGPTLRLQTADPAAIRTEVFAAIESVWPELGPRIANRLE